MIILGNYINNTRKIKQKYKEDARRIQQKYKNTMSWHNTLKMLS